MQQRVTDIPTRAELKLWRTLRRGRGRRASGRFLAEGPRLVREMLDWPGRTIAILHATTGERPAPAIAELLSQAAAQGTRTEEVSEATISALADAATPQPVIAIGGIPSYSWDDILPGTILLLDGVQDPGNLGALVRVAMGLGAAAAVAVGPAADPWGPKAVRASAGAIFRNPVLSTSAHEAIQWLAEKRIPLWAAAAGARPMERRSPAGPVALAVGSEARGVSAALLAAAERHVSITLANGVESLNVATAAAILLDRLRAGS